MSNCICGSIVHFDATPLWHFDKVESSKLHYSNNSGFVPVESFQKSFKFPKRTFIVTNASQNDTSAGSKITKDAPNYGYSKHANNADNAGSNLNSIDDGSKIGASAMAATIAGEIAATKLLESVQEASGYRRKNQSTNSSKEVKLTFDETFFQKIANAEDAQKALDLISRKAAKELGLRVGIVSSEDCSRIIELAIAQGNSNLAFSIISAMQTALFQSRGKKDANNVSSNGIVKLADPLTWQWAGADVNAYVTLVRGLAMSLKVAEAISGVDSLRRRGVPQGDDEVQFGKIVNCPTCIKPLGVVQPQHGIQIIACSSCRYKYELISGDVVNCESETISGNISLIERGLRVLRVIRRSACAATHDMLISTPDGTARTHRFGTESADVPAQEGDRVTIVSAAPTSAGSRLPLGILSRSARTPGWRPSEPMSLTNHNTWRTTPLIRAPPKDGSAAAVETSWILPTLALLATGDAASGLIDPNLPVMLVAGAASTAAIAGTANAFLIPRFNQLPQKSVDSISFRQQLLQQHEMLQQRLESLSQAASQEVRMLARLCQLQNKMEAVGEPSTYGARIERVKRAKDGLDERLTARLDLIDSYAKIASMIEIEVEMDTDILAAEAAGAAENISEQIERLMEVEELQAKWKLQAEANDEVERLLRNTPPL